MEHKTAFILAAALAAFVVLSGCVNGANDASGYKKCDTPSCMEKAIASCTKAKFATSNDNYMRVEGNSEFETAGTSIPSCKLTIHRSDSGTKTCYISNTKLSTVASPESDELGVAYETGSSTNVICI